MNLTDLIRDYYGPLNSATKYPSIPTYHTLGERGRLTEDHNVDWAGATREYTEKIDGTNSRIIFFGRDYVIGSREELLYAQGDRIINPTQQIVETLKQYEGVWNSLYGLRATNIVGSFDFLTVVYGESFGGKIGKAAKGYGDLKFRIFDVQTVPLSIVLENPVDKIALWRENEPHDWLTRAEIQESVPKCDDSYFVPLLDAPPIPESVEDVWEWLQRFKQSGVANCRNEGVVIRSADHKLAAKVRFEDYAKTLGIKNWQ